MNERHGCYNREPFNDGYPAQDGYKDVSGMDGLYARAARVVLVEHTMSRDCRHPERDTDPRCATGDAT